MIGASTSVPSNIIAGDSYSLSLSFGDYPASEGWTATLLLNGASSVTVPGTASGADYAFAITTAKSSLLTEGTYLYAVTLTLGTAKHTVATGYLTVTANATGALNKVLQVERILNAINSAIEGRITDDVQSLSLAGRSISLIPISELMTFRAIYTKELAVMKGGQSAARRTVPVSFSRI